MGMHVAFNAIKYIPRSRGQICGEMDKKPPRRVVNGGNIGIGRGTNDLQEILRGIGAIGRFALENRGMGRGLVSNPHGFRRDVEFKGVI